MQRALLTLAVLVILFGQTVSVSARGNGPCDAHEVLLGHDAYNTQLCAGIAAYDSGRYEEAIAAFKKALDQPVFEYPNFELLPRLALAYHSSGAQRLAEEYLAISELTFSVYFGVLECKEKNNQYWLVDSFGKKVRHPLTERAINRMCGAILEPIYRPETLARIGHNCRLFQMLQSAQVKINGG